MEAGSPEPIPNAERVPSEVERVDEGPRPNGVFDLLESAFDDWRKLVSADVPQGVNDEPPPSAGADAEADEAVERPHLTDAVELDEVGGVAQSEVEPVGRRGVGRGAAV